MAESYTSTQVDSRTFGEQQARLLDDLNRPDLSGLARSYLQDAMRYAQRFPFFFSNTDNSAVPNWAANTTYPQGSTIFFSSGGSTYVAVALNTGVSGGGAPAFTTSIFVVPSGFPPPAIGTPGTTEDNTVRWATIENATVAGHTQQWWTQLSTVYRINQYQPPIDYVAPRLLEVNANALRYRLVELGYEELRSYDVIRPAPITVYPTYWAWFQQRIYLWPYPNTSYPLWLSYRTAPQIADDATDSNFWTTQAEAYIRNYAAGLMYERVMLDMQAAQLAFSNADRERRALQSQAISQQATGGISPDYF